MPSIRWAEPPVLLSPAEQLNILGGESCMWSEYVSGENIDSRIWPRNAAIAERFWSPEDVRDPVSMYARLGVESQRLEWLGLTHRISQRKMLQRMAGPASVDEFVILTLLAQTMEPVKDYSREENVTVEPDEPNSPKPVGRCSGSGMPGISDILCGSGRVPRILL